MSTKSIEPVAKLKKNSKSNSSSSHNASSSPVSLPSQTSNVISKKRLLDTREVDEEISDIDLLKVIQQILPKIIVII